MPGDATDESLPDPETPPEDVFGALGNKKRIHILWALHEAFREGPPDTLLFSELYSRLTIEINSSQLNYHLKHLIGNFVRKTDDGYELSTAGRHLCEALRKGIFDQPQKRMSADAGFDCHFCNKGVEATFNYCRFPVHPTFNQGYIYIQCPSCEYIYVGNIIEVPYEAFIDEKAAFTQFQKYTHHKILAFARGICMICGYEVGAEFHAAEEIPLPIFGSCLKVV